MIVYHLILADHVSADKETALCGKALDRSTCKDYEWTTIHAHLNVQLPEDCEHCVAAIPPLLILKHTTL